MVDNDHPVTVRAQYLCVAVQPASARPVLAVATDHDDGLADRRGAGIRTALDLLDRLADRVQLDISNRSLRSIRIAASVCPAARRHVWCTRLQDAAALPTCAPSADAGIPARLLGNAAHE